MALCPFSDEEWENLPHIIITDELNWDPRILDSEPTEDEQWFDAQEIEENQPGSEFFDAIGDYRHRVSVQFASSLLHEDPDPIEESIDYCVFHSQASLFEPFLKGLNPFYQVFENEVDHRLDDTGEPPPDVSQHLKHLQAKKPDYKT